MRGLLPGLLLGALCWSVLGLMLWCTIGQHPPEPPNAAARVVIERTR